MHFVTQCANCQTFFKIVPDQLKLRGGMVRCGVCAESFNALEALHQVGEEAPPPAPAAPSSSATPPSIENFIRATKEAEMKAAEAVELKKLQAAEKEQSQTITPAAADPSAKKALPPEEAPSKPRNVFDRRQHIIGAAKPGADAGTGAAAKLATDGSVPVVAASVAPDAARTAPIAKKTTFTPEEIAQQPVLDQTVSEEEFAPLLRQMKQYSDLGSLDFLDEEDDEYAPPPKRPVKAAPKKPAVSKSKKNRMGWFMLCVFMILVLITQLLWFFRVTIETSSPHFYYLTKAVCETIGCEALPVLRKGELKLVGYELEASEVHNGADTEADLSSHQHLLRMTIRNSLSVPQQWPSIELQLIKELPSDTDQPITEVVVRKVLRPEDYLTEKQERLVSAGKDEEVSVPLEINTAYDNTNINLFYE